MSDTPLRILMIVFNQTGQGTFWRAHYLARSLAKAGNRVTILTAARVSHKDVGPQPEPGSRVTLVESPSLLGALSRSGWDPIATMVRTRWISRADYDIIHAFESRPSVILPALYGRRQTGRPLILDWADWLGRGGSVEERRNPLVRIPLRPIETYFEEAYRTRADGTTVICQLLHQKALDLGVRPGSIHPLPNGCAVDTLQSAPVPPSRDALGLSQGILLIGYLGSLFRNDGRLMAKAFDLVQDMEPRARLMIVGYCDQPVEAFVRNPASVMRTGPVPTPAVNTAIAACNVCWLPMCDTGANRGRFPLKLNDYMAMGRPTIVTDVGDVPDVVRAANAGAVANASAGDLATQTLDLLRDNERCEALGQSARRFAEAHLSWDHVGQSLLRFYLQVQERHDDQA
jgi:glycosyltransferase involved in cell wall biosynthesis